MTSAFDLPPRLTAKADPELIARDEQQFTAIEAAMAETVAEVSTRLAAARRAPAGSGQAAMDRDLLVRRLTAQLQMLQRFSLDVCLGRTVRDDDPEPVYIGRLGLADRQGRRLLIDWRSQAAEPFFAATHAHPMGLRSRRRYRWIRGRVSDYWDEVFTADGLEDNAALDDQSAFIASLSGGRSAQMRDVLGTIQADQDAIIRADARGPLVVDGGPGTGKTVVALHRAAYLLYADRRLASGRGGLLFVGPHRPYLAYVADVLPRLGEEGVQMCTVADLVPEGATAVAEPDPEVARLKESAQMVAAIEPAVRLYEEPPSHGMLVETPWAEVWLSPEDWADAFGAVDPGTPHNEARDQIREELLEILLAKAKAEEVDVPAETLRAALAGHRELTEALRRAWPLIEATDLVGDLWEVPAYLRRCAPWLSADQVSRLQREDPQAWTVADLPLLDAARHRLGDPEASRRARRQRAAVAAARSEMDRVVEHLVATDDSEMQVMSMLRVSDAQSVIIDEAPFETHDPDRLAGPFAHIVVDEAQELTDAEWLMLLRRCPSASLTIVGDRAQARRGFTETWEERLARVGLQRSRIARLSINYRTPDAVMTHAEPVIRAVLPDANVPTSIRTGGAPVRFAAVTELDAILQAWLAQEVDGTACVIGRDLPDSATLCDSERINSLPPEHAKGLEFDLVVLVEPDSFGAGIEGGVDRYVAMTRATEQLVILNEH